MCGIVGAVAERNVVEILLEGLKRLEYRGYDSAGVALLQSDGALTRIRRTGKVQELVDAIGGHLDDVLGQIDADSCNVAHGTSPSWWLRLTSDTPILALDAVARKWEVPSFIICFLVFYLL